MITRTDELWVGSERICVTLHYEAGIWAAEWRQNGYLRIVPPGPGTCGEALNEVRRVAGEIAARLASPAELHRMREVAR